MKVKAKKTPSYMIAGMLFVHESTWEGMTKLVHGDLELIVNSYGIELKEILTFSDNEIDLDVVKASPDLVEILKKQAEQ